MMYSFHDFMFLVWVVGLGLGVWTVDHVRHDTVLNVVGILLIMVSFAGVQVTAVLTDREKRKFD